jgi:hypothetical protein
MIENGQLSGDSEHANQGLAFLEGLETRHRQVLDELDALNTRIESVLDSYARHRSSGNGEGTQADGGPVT